MKQFAVRNGDFALGEGGFATVEGVAKVRQDLDMAAGEPFGIDRFHPRWGSLLHNYIGMNDPDEAAALIRSEVYRLVQNYISLQAYQVAQDAKLGRKTRFGAGELVDRVTSVTVQPQLDRFFVRVSVRTFSGAEIVLADTVR